MRGTDWSNYQPVPSDSDCAALLAAGFTFAIVGLQQPGHAQQQIDALRAGGITVEDCYLESNPAPPLPDVARVWVAVERGSGFEDEAAIDAALAYIAQEGKAAGSYSSPYEISLLGLTAAFAGKYADLPKWIADYDGVAAPLAGAAIKQYSGNGLIPGIAYALDLDFQEDVPEEPTVEIRELDQSETIDAFTHIAERLGMELNDQNGETMVEVTAGAPKPVPAGYHGWFIVTRDT